MKTEYNVCKSGSWMFSLLIRKQTFFLCVKLGKSDGNCTLLIIPISARDLNREKLRGNK